MPSELIEFLQTGYGLLATVVAAGGGGAAVAVLVIRSFGDRWLQAKFDRQLEDVRHQQNVELSRLRIEIDSMLSGALKLQEREFEVLPTLWANVFEAHRHTAGVASPLKTFPDMRRASELQLDEFLSGTPLSDSQKDEVRNASNRTEVYGGIIFRYQMGDAQDMHKKMQIFIAQNAIFIPDAILAKVRALGALLWHVIVHYRTGHEAEEFKMMTAAWEKLDTEAKPLMDEIEALVRERLQSHREKQKP